jgi:hypothetical protein
MQVDVNGSRRLGTYRLSLGRGAFGHLRQPLKKDPGGGPGLKRQLPPTGARECGGQPRRRRRSTAKESDHRRTDPAQQYHLPALVETLPREFPTMQHMVLVVN